MTYISNITNITTAITYDYRPFVSMDVWIVIFAASLLFMVLSHLVKRGNDMHAIIAIIFAAAALWGGMSLATYDDLMYEFVNNTSDANVTDLYYSASIHVVAAPWLTILLVVYLVMTFLNLIYVYYEYVVRNAPRVNQDRRIR